MTDPSEFMAPVDAVSGGAGRPSKRRIEVRWLPVEALRPDDRNARVHVPRQVARIADSIAAFGFNVPVLVDENGGVIAGHGRALAARRLGLKEVPTIALDHLDEAQRRAFMIADNRLGELASWDEARLGLELEGLKTLDLDFALSAIGFELSEIDLRIGAADAVDSPSKDGRPSGRPMGRVGRPPSRSPRGARQQGPPAARAGDAWSLGPHRLICGDDSDAGAFLAIDAAIRRWQAAAGQSAKLHPTGETFASIARARRRPLSRRERGRGEGVDAGRERR